MRQPSDSAKVGIVKMAIVLQASWITVSTMAVRLDSRSLPGARMVITNTSANAADIGGATVTAGTGYSLPAGASVQLTLNPADVVYAIRSGATDAVLSVLIS
jgi:hypothetical protein